VAVVGKRPTKGSAHTAFTSLISSLHYPKGGDKSAEFQEFLENRLASAAAGDLLHLNSKSTTITSGKHALGDKRTLKEAKAGAGLAFVSYYQKKHPEEWRAFEAQWKAHRAGVVETDIVPEPVAMAAPVPVAVAMAAPVPVPVAVPMPMHVSSSIAELIANYGSEGESSASSSAPKRRGRKALKDMTPEELAAHNVKVAVIREKKAAAAAAAGCGGGSSV